MPGERPPRPAAPFPGQQAGVGTDSEQNGIQRHSEHWLLSAQDGAGRILSVSGSVAAAPHGVSFADVQQYHELGDSIKASEKRLTEIAVLKAHIINYAKTRPVYDAYRKTGYSKRFLETHRTEITLHKAAKAAFDEANLKTLPKVKELDAEYSKRLTEKKARYPDYRKAKEEMQELLRAKKNVELFFAEEKSGAEKMKSR